MFVDTHTHLLDDRFNDIRREIIDGFAQDEIDFVVECGTDEADIERVVRLAESNRKIYAAIGIHPHSADAYSPEAEQKIRQLAKSKKVVAIGEIGLDFHYDFSARDVQEKVFAQQIRLAESLSLPVVVHSREATKETYEILAESNARGELHCFSGSAETAERYLAKGFYIAFGGSVTFKNAKKVVRAAQAVPLERLLIETDCPYLAPVPMRGGTNRPAYVRYVAEKLSEIKGVAVERIAQAARENAMRLFHITED